MGKEHPVRRTVQEFSEWSTVHGISYIFSPSLPTADRLLWALLVFISFGLASYWSMASYNTWQEELTITTLKVCLKFPYRSLMTLHKDLWRVNGDLNGSLFLRHLCLLLYLIQRTLNHIVGVSLRTN